MCSRYNLTSPPEAVRAYFGYSDTPNFPARYNIAPTQPIAVVARDLDTVAILTCDSNRTVSPLHDPVVLPPEHFAAWLDVKGTAPEEAAALLRSAPDDLFEAIEMPEDK
jgi:putative SOS response-associated peptidase YedK